jgi:hypothetical protein
MKFRELEMNPLKNPAVLDTATWDPAAAWEIIRSKSARWLVMKPSTPCDKTGPEPGGITSSSCVWQGSVLYALAGLPDGQQTFVRIGPAGNAPALGAKIGEMALPGGPGYILTAYPAEASVVDRFCRTLSPPNAPRALGQTPRLGIGVRMTTMVWPGIFDAMVRAGFAANSIQNSVRELNLMDDLLDAKPAPRNYACGFGTIETGYTGSSFEGLWLSGVLTALQRDEPLRYGADADHIQVKRADTGLAWAKRVLDAARYYTFYTIDVSDVLNYDAKTFADKYGAALDALAALREHIQGLKDGVPFDLELSIDEHPAEVHAFDCLTSDEELRFVLHELERRALPISHVAPNFGVEKGVDYRHPAGLTDLHRRVEAQHRIAQEFGVMLDFHSADDLGPAVREALRKATNGHMHYKISPSLQLMFADVLKDFHPDLFKEWWNDAMTYAMTEAKAGSPFATECIAAGGAGSGGPSPKHPVFHHYSFAYVGRRDAQGRFLHRDKFYSLSPEFLEAYRRRLSDHLSQLAKELF